MLYYSSYQESNDIKENQIEICKVRSMFNPSFLIGAKGYKRETNWNL